MATVSLHGAYELVSSNSGHRMWGGDRILVGRKVYSFLWADRELCQGTWLNKQDSALHCSFDWVLCVVPDYTVCVTNCQMRTLRLRNVQLRTGKPEFTLW